MQNGRRHGKGTLFYANGNELRADFVDGVPHGIGEMRFKNGDVYEGEFRNGTAHGRGRLTRHNGQIYEARFDFFSALLAQTTQGQWANDKMEGQGVYHYNEGHQYVKVCLQIVFTTNTCSCCQQHSTKERSRTTCSTAAAFASTTTELTVSPQFLSYILSWTLSDLGEWKDDCMHGQARTLPLVVRHLSPSSHTQGAYIRPDGTRYEGAFSHDEYSGFGLYIYPSGTRYVGNVRPSALLLGLGWLGAEIDAL